MEVSMETNSYYKVNSLQSYSILGDMRTLLGNTETTCWIVINWLTTTRGLTTVVSVGKQEVPTTKLITHFLQSMNMVKQYGAHTVSVHV